MASPPQMMCLSRVLDSMSLCARKACSIEGTKLSVVIWWRWISSTRRAGSRWSPGLATTSRAPAVRGQNISHTDTSKPNGALCSTVFSRLR